MRFFKLIISYDGKDFFGWQWQPKLRTVQGAIEQAVYEVCGQNVTAIASGRTDAGVHAVGQVVSFACETNIPASNWKRALNANLPDDVCVLDVQEAPFGFHATRDAVKKRYRYVIQDGRNRDVFARPYAWWLWRTLDEGAMNRAAQHLLGRHDFTSFETSGSSRLSTIRTILEISVERRLIDWSEKVVIEVEADGFLYNMVRNIAGTLVEIGKGKQPEDWTRTVLAAKDRRTAGMAAPPQGLFLMKVDIDWGPHAVPPDAAMASDDR